MTGIDIVGMLLMLISPVLLVITIAQGIRKKPYKAFGIATICCIILCIICAYLSPKVPKSESVADVKEANVPEIKEEESESEPKEAIQEKETLVSTVENEADKQPHVEIK